MIRFAFIALCVGLITPPTVALAEREVHVVSVYEGNTRSGDLVHGPQTRVLVDRPDQNVTLVITAFRPVRWFIETTPDTDIDDIVVGGNGADRSEVFVNDIAYEFVPTEDLPASHRSAGERFRALVEQLPDRFDVAQVGSFNGIYTAPAEAIVVDGVAGVGPRLQADYLTELVTDPSILPQSIQTFLAQGQPEPAYTVDLMQNAIRLTGPDGAQEFPVSLDVPRFIWPTGAAYDEDTKTVYVVTQGGEGYLYALDVETSTWSVVRSLDDFDAHGILRDNEGQRFIMTGGVFEPAEFRILTDRRAVYDFYIPASDLPGFTDIYDVGNGPNPRFVPVFHDGDWVIVTATPEFPRGPIARSRTYAINIQTKQALLLEYQN